jgi:hypothetical protein
MGHIFITKSESVVPKPFLRVKMKDLPTGFYPRDVSSGGYDRLLRVFPEMRGV